MAPQLTELFVRPWPGITGESTQLEPKWHQTACQTSSSSMEVIYGGSRGFPCDQSRGNCGKTNQGRFGESDLFVTDMFLVKEDTKLVSETEWRSGGGRMDVSVQDEGFLFVLLLHQLEVWVFTPPPAGGGQCLHLQLKLWGCSPLD